MLDRINLKNRKRSMKEYSIDDRKKICFMCPIYDAKNQKCNSKLWLNPDTNEVSTHSKLGFIRGCGCLIAFRAKNLSNHCVAGKW